MKSLSASIVVFSGSLVFAGGAFIPHWDTAVFVMLIGGVITVFGLIGWKYSLTQCEK